MNFPPQVVISSRQHNWSRLLSCFISVFYMKLYKSDMSATSRPKISAITTTRALFPEISIFLQLSVTGFCLWLLDKNQTRSFGTEIEMMVKVHRMLLWHLHKTLKPLLFAVNYLATVIIKLAHTGALRCFLLCNSINPG